METIADGIVVKRPGEIPYEYVSKYVDEIITVSDQEIFDVILHLMEYSHLIVEGAGASGIAAIKSNKIPIHNNIGCIISGGNIDIALLNRVVQKALHKQKRVVKIKLEVKDEVGVLESILSTIALYKGNIVSIHHDRLNPELKINTCITRIEYESQSQHDAIMIDNELKDKGFKFLKNSRTDSIE